MKEISLTQGHVVIVDKEDFDWLSQFKWCVNRKGSKLYATRWGNIKMHRLIMSPLDGFQVDHINGNGLDNRRCNLRLCTHAENQHNRRKNQGKQGFKGIGWVKSRNLWQARIRVDGDQKHLGYFTDSKSAAQAYNDAAIKYFGEFAYLNNVSVME